MTQAGAPLLVLNPRQTSSWAARLGLRAKTAGSDAHTLARERLAGEAPASVRPMASGPSLRTLTRARRDLVHSQTPARQRLHDAVGPLFPELLSHWPHHADRGAPALLPFLSQSSSAQASAPAPLAHLAALLAQARSTRWGEREAPALPHLARHWAARPRTAPARRLVVRTPARHWLDRRARLVDLEAASATLVADADDA